MNKKWSAAAALSVAVALTASGCGMFGGGALEAMAEESLGTAVEVQQVQRTSIANQLTYIGQVEPATSISVVSKLSAEVQSVHFDVGDRVEQGDVLFTVDAKDLEDQIRQLQASVQAQAAAVQAQQIAVQAQQVSVQASQVGVESAEYGLELAENGSAQERLTELQAEAGAASARYGARSADYSRQQAKQAVEDAEDAYDYAVAAAAEANKALADYGTPPNSSDPAYASYILLKQAADAANAAVFTADAAIERAEDAYQAARNASYGANATWDIAGETVSQTREVLEEGREQAVKQAEFGVRNAEVGLQASEVGVLSAEAGVLSAEAGLQATQVQIDIAASNLSNAVIRSPISGVVSDRSVEVGQMISQAVAPFTIVSVDTVNVQVNVSETLINSLRVGEQVEVLIQSVSDTPLTGTITAVSPAASATSTYPVRVELSNAGGTVKPGMFAQVTFTEEERFGTFVVDKNVVLSDETSSYVYVVQNGMAHKTPVTTGLSNGAQLEITSGLNQGDQVVVVGQEYIYEGTPVNIVAMDGDPVQRRAPAASDQTADSGEPEENTGGEAPADDPAADEEEPGETA